MASGVIDAHVHVFPPEMVRDREKYLERDPRFAALYGSPEARMATAPEVTAHMAEAGVEVSVVFGYAFADQGLCRLVNDYVIEAVAADPRRLVGLACVWPEGAGAAAEVERCLRAGLRGCGELVLEAWASEAAAAGGRGAASGRGRGRVGGGRPGLDGLLEIAELLRRHQAPLLVHANEPVGHAYPGKGPFGPQACVALAETLPGLSLVFAHLGGGAFLYEAMPEVRAILADAYYDTSAVPYLYRTGIYQAVLATAGPGKLIFGSDYPLLSPGRYAEGLGSLPPVEREAVCAGNARKVFGI